MHTTSVTFVALVSCVIQSVLLDTVCESDESDVNSAHSADDAKPFESQKSRKRIRGNADNMFRDYFST